jgi:hypothetical protein
VTRSATILMVAALAAPLAAQEKTSPTIARETAESNAKTPAGRRYQSALASSLDAWLARAIQRCGKGVSKEDAVGFDVLVEIGDNGKAEDVLLSPETSIGRCAREDFQDAKYPFPPQPHWWVRVPIELR